MRFSLLLVLTLLVTACVSVRTNNTKSVSFNATSADTMPREVALDAVVSYSKATSSYYYATCLFIERGVQHKTDGEVVPFTQTCFYADNVTYAPLDHHSHIFMVNQANGTAICDSMLARQYFGQEHFQEKMKWLGTALLSLGSEYCPEMK